MKILVTGAAGFVGGAIVSELSTAGYELAVTVRNECLTDKLPSESVIYELDLTNLSEFSELEKINNLDVIIHTAGLAHQSEETPRKEFFRVNVTATENLLKLAKKLSVRHFVLISSVAVYGAAKDKKSRRTDENSKCRPVGGYAESKLEAEKAALKFCVENNLALTILRPVTVIGEGDRGNVSRLIKMIEQKKFIWVGCGENSKSLIYKNDLAKACRLVLEQKFENRKDQIEIFNISGDALQMREIVGIIAVGLDIKIRKIIIPSDFSKFLLKALLKFVKIKKLQTILETVEKWTADDVFRAEKIATVYGFKPETSVKRALQRELEFYLANK